MKLKPELTAIDESVGMILPEEALERLGVDRGDTLLLVEEKGGFRIARFDPGFEKAMESAR